MRATGEVVSYHEIPDGDDTRYRPRIRFRTATGEIVTVGGQLCRPRQALRDRHAGAHGLHGCAKPTEARVALFIDNWLGACIAAVVGLVGLAGGFLVRRSVRRELAKIAAHERALRQGLLPALLFRLAHGGDLARRDAGARAT